MYEVWHNNVFGKTQLLDTISFNAFIDKYSLHFPKSLYSKILKMNIGEILEFGCLKLVRIEYPETAQSK